MVRFTVASHSKRDTCDDHRRRCLIFTVRRYALHGICDSNSVRLSVRLSVTLVDYVHMAHRKILA